MEGPRKIGERDGEDEVVVDVNGWADRGKEGRGAWIEGEGRERERVATGADPERWSCRSLYISHLLY